MVDREWLRKLQKTDRNKLCKYNLKDFIEISQSAFLSSRVIKMLDLLKTASYMSADLLFDFYVLAYVYRETEHFEEIVTGGVVPLLKSLSDKNDSFSVRNYARKNIKQIFKEIRQTKQKTIQADLLSGKLSELSKNALEFVNRMRKLFTRFSSSKIKRKQPKNESIFNRIYERERTSKCPVCDLLRKEAKKKQISYAALRRGYYRWKNGIRENLPVNQAWPSDGFLKFCAFISVKYVPEKSDSQYYFLCEEPGVETNQIYNALHETMKNQSCKDQLQAEYDEAMTYFGKEREARLRPLIRKNYLPAFERLFELVAPRYKEPYFIRAAILGDTESQKKLKWQAVGLCDLRLEVASQNRLRVAGITDLPSGIPIKPRTILRSIKFQINTNTDEWRNIRSKFKRITILPPEYIPFYIQPIENPCWETISMPATTKNFSLLMQNVDSLRLYRIFVCFSSRHNTRQEQKEFDIFRVYSPPEKNQQKDNTDF